MDMEKVRLLAQALDRLRLTRRRQEVVVASTTRPMSDQELAHAIREVRRDWAAVPSERARQALISSHEVLRNPMPDTFPGRKTQKPFPNEDEV
jgi:hypothetical protein